MPGLSPHARGNHGRHEANSILGLSPHAPPSTPAQPIDLGLSPHARGNPSHHVHRNVQREPVYPRTRGATAGAAPSFDRSTRVYPRTRGATVTDLTPEEPQSQRVYPRTRGATAGMRSASRHGWGLSPHARGNHVEAPALNLGSIPARAGQPRSHPRVVFVLSGSIPARAGQPSLGRRQMLCTSGSIPARAGQPLVHLIKTARLYLLTKYC